MSGKMAVKFERRRVAASHHGTGFCHPALLKLTDVFKHGLRAEWLPKNPGEPTPTTLLFDPDVLFVLKQERLI